ncbi:MAG: hypothetical protein OCD01_03060 [Fibrobacterales bacterium]
MSFLRKLPILIATASLSLFAEDFTFSPPEESSSSSVVELSSSIAVPSTPSSQSTSYDSDLFPSDFAQSNTKEESSTFPKIYGWAYPEVMGGNVAITASVPDFLLHPSWITGSDFVYINPNSKKGMLAVSALGGSVFGYADQDNTVDGTDIGTLTMGYAGPDNSFGVALYTSQNSEYNYQKSYQRNQLFPDSVAVTTTEIDTATGEIYGIFADVSIAKINIYTDINYFRLSSLNSSLSSPDEESTMLVSLSKLGLNLGLLYQGDAHYIDTKVSLDLYSDEGEASYNDKNNNFDTTTTFTGLNNLSVLNLKLNYGYIAKSTSAMNIYLGTQLSFEYTMWDDIEPDEFSSLSRIDKSSHTIEFTPNASLEYMLSKYLIVFGGIQHTIARNGSSDRDVVDTDPGVNVKLETSRETEAYTLQSNSTNTSFGLRVSYDNLSIESILSNTVYENGTSDLFNGKGTLINTTIGVLF